MKKPKKVGSKAWMAWMRSRRKHVAIRKARKRQSAPSKTRIIGKVRKATARRMYRTKMARRRTYRRKKGIIANKAIKAAMGGVLAGVGMAAIPQLRSPIGQGVAAILTSNQAGIVGKAGEVLAGVAGMNIGQGFGIGNLGGLTSGGGITNM